MTGPRVRIVQLLCPARHTIVAVAYLSQDGAPEVRHSLMVQNASRLGMVQAYCGICGSDELRIEDAATRYTTMAEAQPALATIERENMETRRRVDAARNN